MRLVGWNGGSLKLLLTILLYSISFEEIRSESLGLRFSTSIFGENGTEAQKTLKRSKRDLFTNENLFEYPLKQRLTYLLTDSVDRLPKFQDHTHSIQ